VHSQRRHLGSHEATGRGYGSGWLGKRRSVDRADRHVVLPGRDVGRPGEIEMLFDRAIRGQTAKDLRVGFVEWQGVARRQHGPDRSCPAPPGRSPPGCDLATAARRCARGGPTRGVPAPRAPTYLGVGDHRRIAILCCPGGAIRPETSLGTDVVTTSGQSPGRRLSTSSSGKRKPRASQGWVENRRILYHEVRRKPRASQGWVENRRILYHEVRRKPGECRCGP